MKIGIITFHASFNYGSMLQAWALQTFLTKLGHDVEIINFRQKSQKLGYAKPIAFSSLPNVKRSVKRMLAPATIRPLYRKWHLFDGFMHRWLNLTDEYNTLDQLRQAGFDLDALITGSDQIWNTTVFDFSEAYFGTFVDRRTAKIAYAPSMGPDPESQDEAYLKSLLNGYKAVSVREERTKDFLESNGICGNVSVVLDPTMLLDAADYGILYDQKPLVDGQYIFYYTPGYGPRHEFLREASYLGRQLNLPVICDNCYIPGALRGYDNIRPHIATGPTEFLNLVKKRHRGLRRVVPPDGVLHPLPQGFLLHERRRRQPYEQSDEDAAARRPHLEHHGQKPQPHCPDRIHCGFRRGIRRAEEKVAGVSGEVVSRQIIK